MSDISMYRTDNKKINSHIIATNDLHGFNMTLNVSLTSIKY
jgi:hypothetical protein